MRPEHAHWEVGFVAAMVIGGVHALDNAWTRSLIQPVIP